MCLTKNGIYIPLQITKRENQTSVNRTITALGIFLTTTDRHIWQVLRDKPTKQALFSPSCSLVIITNATDHDPNIGKEWPHRFGNSKINSKPIV
jgi:hypothetical protein